MNRVELEAILEWLEKLAPSNPERIALLRAKLSNVNKDELQQFDHSTLTWLLGVMLEAEGVPAKVEIVMRPITNLKAALQMGSESTDPDELLDETSWPGLS